MNALTDYAIKPATKKMLSIICLLGCAGTVVGLFLAPDRIWYNILIAAQFLISLGLGGLVLIALTYVTKAGWSAVVRRVPEAMTQTLPLAAFVMALTAFGISSIYEWSHQSVVASDPLLQEKAAYLNVPFFLIRMGIYFAVWLAFAYVMRRNSEKQDITGDVALTKKNERVSAGFLAAGAVTIWLSSTDWIMSLEPHWFSTIFGMYNIAGTLLSGTAGAAVLIIVLNRRGAFGRQVREDHYHDLGKLLFAFATFWMYLWFCQYMLIWYANIPEETTFFIRRENASWTAFTVLNLLFNWALPFIALLSARAKRNEGMLLKVSIVVLIGRWIDYYWMIAPVFTPDAPFVGVWEIAPMAALCSAFFLVALLALSKKNTVPINDPYLVESLHYHS